MTIFMAWGQQKFFQDIEGKVSEENDKLDFYLFYMCKYMYYEVGKNCEQAYHKRRQTKVY